MADKVMAGASGGDVCQCGHVLAAHNYDARGSHAPGCGGFPSTGGKCGCVTFQKRATPIPEGRWAWHPIATAPKDGTRIDLWAKAWLPAFDRFEFRRFADCVWMQGDSMCNRPPYWLNLDKEWCPTHWVPLPAPPSDAISPPQPPHRSDCRVNAWTNEGPCTCGVSPPQPRSGDGIEAATELVAKWRAKAAQEHAASREANHAGNIELDAYRDGKSMALKDCVYDLEALVLTLTQQLAEAKEQARVVDVIHRGMMESLDLNTWSGKEMVRDLLAHVQELERRLQQANTTRREEKQ